MMRKGERGDQPNQHPMSFSRANRTEICPDLTPNQASGERHPIVARPG